MKVYTAYSELQAFMNDQPHLFPVDLNRMTVTQNLVQSSASVTIAPKDTTVSRVGPWVSNQQQHDNMQIFTSHTSMPISKEPEWVVTLNKLKQYIASNDQFPQSDSKEPEITKLERWVSTQKLSYKGKTDLMMNQTIRIQWESFMECYPLVFREEQTEIMKSRKIMMRWKAFVKLHPSPN
jgi:hypothetical protein